MYLEISFVVFSVVFLLLVLISIPFFIQIWRTAKNISITLNMLNESLPGILKNLEEITTNINRATRIVNTQMESLSLCSARLQASLGFLLDLDSALRSTISLPFMKSLRTANAFLKGVKVFLDVLRSSR